jgi:hypothetical protein
MRVGIDFDNTLIDYDRVFIAAAREKGLVAVDFTGTKRAVRDAIRALPEGELTWQRLQGEVYGTRIGGAVPFAGAGDFLRRCAREGIATFIVSHKTQYGHFDPTRTDLREAARGWMIAQGFMDPEHGGIPPDCVYFEDDRAAKLRRILLADEAARCCDVHCTDWQQIATVVFGDAL